MLDWVCESHDPEVLLWTNGDEGGEAIRSHSPAIPDHPRTLAVPDAEMAAHEV